VAPARSEFYGKWGINDEMGGNGAIVVNVLVKHECDKSAYFDVQPANLFLGTFDPKMQHHCLALSWLGPWLLAYIIPGVTEEVKLCEQCLVHDICPRKLFVHCRESSSSLVVGFECTPNGFGTCLERL
jgi:hypothetical protein